MMGKDYTEGHKLRREFDFVLRANLSSFFAFPNLLKFLESCPKRGFYGSGGVTHCYGYGWRAWGQGSGFLLSSDLVHELIVHRDRLYGATQYHDDLVVAQLLMYTLQYLLSDTPRVDLLSVEDWYRDQEIIPSSAFHFRIKSLEASQHISQDIFIYHKLLQRFYPSVEE